MLSIKVLRTSLASPEQNHEGCFVSVATALAKVIDNATVGGKLTDAHSEPDVRDITAHPRTFGANQQPAVPGSKI